MITVYGALAKKFPKRNKIKVNSAVEAIKAMDANFPGFSNSIKKDKQYIVVRGDSLKEGKSITEDEVNMKFSEKDWHILPVPMGYGGKGGIFSIVLGVVLLAVAYFVPVTAPYLVPLGTSMVLGGIAQLLAPAPPTFDYKDRSAEEKPSYLFDGPVNLSEPGLTIPAAYGETFIGSIFISGGLEVNDTI